MFCRGVIGLIEISRQARNDKSSYNIDCSCFLCFGGGGLKSIMEKIGFGG